MGKWIQQIESWIGGGPGGEKRIRSFRWLILIGLIGVMLMILNSFISVQDLDSSSQGRASPPPEEEVFMGNAKEESPFAEIEKSYEDRLKEMLTQMAGVSGVEVMITIESTEEKLVYQNERDTQQITDEKDRNGANRHITDLTREGEIVLYTSGGEETPIILKTIKPKIRGVVVVAGGAENATVRKLIADAVQKGLAVPPHRISIIPRKQT